MNESSDVESAGGRPPRDLRCPSCRSTAFSPFRFGLLRCESCALVVDRVAIEHESQATLQQDWFGVPDAAMSPWIRLFEAWNNGRTRSRLARYVQPPARVLEVGVGSGSLLASLRQQGFDVHGCDLSVRTAEYVQRELGIPVFAGPLASMPVAASFDVVVMNHVVEHTADPIAFLQGARRLTRPGALFHLAVPNVASWNAHLPGWASYEPYHLVYFSPRTFQAVVSLADLEILECATYEAFSGWFLALLRTALGQRLTHAERRERTRRARARSGIEHAYRAAMLAAGAASYPLRRVQTWLGAGEEIVVLARNGSGSH